MPVGWGRPTALFEPLIPLRPPELYGRTGQPRTSDGDVLEGIAFVLSTGSGWAKLPTEFSYGSGWTCWRRMHDWAGAGVFDWLHVLFGVCMYLSMRVTGTIWAAIVLHALTNPTTMLATGGIDEPVGRQTDTIWDALAGYGVIAFMVFAAVAIFVVRGKVGDRAELTGARRAGRGRPSGDSYERFPVLPGQAGRRRRRRCGGRHDGHSPGRSSATFLTTIDPVRCRIWQFAGVPYLT